MKRFAMQFLVAVSALACSACATTAFESTWKSPDAKPLHLRDRKVAAVFVSRELVYSLEDDELVWAGVSRTFEPLRIESFIAELAAAVSEEMARDGLIAER